MGEIATKKKPVFVQANSNSSEGHVLHYITSFCVVFRLSTLYFWLAGKTETKQVVNRMSKWVEGGGSWKGHESGQAVFIVLVLARFAREFRGYAAPAPGSTKPPCYAGYDKFGRLYRAFGIQHAAFLCLSSYEQLVFALARNQPSLFTSLSLFRKRRW